MPKTTTTKSSRGEVHDIQIRIDDLNREMEILLHYLQDCNSRKLQLFKIALTVVTIVSGACFSIYAIYSDPHSIGIQSPFDYVFGILLIIIGVVTFTIITELMSLHSSRVITIRQANCLRQALDSLRFQRIEGRYPVSIDELSDDSTEYWKYFGQHRKLPLENAGLRNSENGWFQSPDHMMIGTLTLLSFVVLISPLIFLGLSDAATFKDGLFSGATGLVFLWAIVNRWKSARKHLNVQLGTVEEQSRTI